jgi:hypothetical protein
MKLVGAILLLIPAIIASAIGFIVGVINYKNEDFWNYGIGLLHPKMDRRRADLWAAIKRGHIFTEGGAFHYLKGYTSTWFDADGTEGSSKVVSIVLCVTVPLAAVQLCKMLF